MRLLVIDTCGATGSVALADTDAAEPLLGEVGMGERTSAERLIPAIREVLELGGLSLAQLDAIAVVHGPGSFTGIRIGISAAKGLAVATGVPVVALSRLAVLASKFLLAQDDSGGKTLHVAMDAGRGEFYYGRYCSSQLADALTPSAWRLECEVETLLSREDLEAEVEGTGAAGKMVVCEQSVLLALNALCPAFVTELAAADALPRAMLAVEETLFADVELLDANYLRRSDLEMLARMKAHAARDVAL